MRGAITYVIDNGYRSRCHALYFVEAPRDFGKWFEETLVPWLREREIAGARMKIVATCREKLDWRDEGTSMRWDAFLDDESLVETMDYDEEPALHRPRYRGV